MSDDLQPWAQFIEKVRRRTPARVLVDRAGEGYRTSTQLELRQAHAAARDAVRAELDLDRDFGPAFLESWNLFEVFSEARSKDEYLLRPDLGRRLNETARRQIVARCPESPDFQVVIGDGLSVTAVATQVPALLPLLGEAAHKKNWKMGQPFIVHYCRVGIMNDIGEALRPRVMVLLIGERPGLATAQSLSAYLAFQPRSGHTDADRNLISNVHARGVPVEAAAVRIINLAAQMMDAQRSGSTLREKPVF